MTRFEPPASRLPWVGTTIFTVMSQLARETGALNLSQGFPEFSPPLLLLERAAHYLHTGNNQYAPMAGIPELREALALKTQDLYGVSYHPESEITITSGATEALYAAIAAVVRPGDEVIVIEPAYDSYVPAVTLNGGTPVYVALKPPHHRIDWQELRGKMTGRTRLILINTPHNPAGTVFSSDDIEQLAALVRGTSVMIASDEVYEHIVFDGKKHLSLMTHPDLRERAFIVGSFGKTFHITGWKVGYCFAPRELTSEFRKVHQYLTFSTVTPLQHAIADLLRHPEYYLALSGFYQRKRDLFIEASAGAGLGCLPSQGTFFQSLYYGDLSEEHDFDLACRLTRETGVACIPVSAFYHERNDYKMLRFCFAKDDETLMRAGERLGKVKWEVRA